MPAITDLPLKIVEIIADELDSSDDLLAFALAAKVIASAIPPQYTQLRHIRCDVKAMCLWRVCSRDLFLARNVRTLEITEHRPCRLPRFICACGPTRSCNLSATRRNAELQLVVAILSNLRSFKWLAKPNTVIAQKETDGEDVWTPPRTAQALERWIFAWSMDFVTGLV
ncbi:hypothetical protein BKA93DRAFT_445953 [Sparassis latifolia]